MDILKLNTSPSFEIVPRKVLDISKVFKFQLVNEMNQKKQDVLATVQLLPNENYQITMASFPNGKTGDKIAYVIIDNLTNEIISLGKIIIVSQNENVQDYSKKSNNKFYK